MIEQWEYGYNETFAIKMLTTNYSVSWRNNNASTGDTFKIPIFDRNLDKVSYTGNTSVSPKFTVKGW